MNYVLNTTKTLWTNFKTTFKLAWKDSERAQNAYKQLMKLLMKDLDINLYNAMFEHLALAAGWEANAQGMIE